MIPLSAFLTASSRGVLPHRSSVFTSAWRGSVNKLHEYVSPFKEIPGVISKVWANIFNDDVTLIVAYRRTTENRNSSIYPSSSVTSYLAFLYEELDDVEVTSNNRKVECCSAIIVLPVEVYLELIVSVTERSC